MSKYYGKMVVATVSRGPMEQTPVTCFEHEIPLLKERHGDGSVKLEPVPEGTVPSSVIGMKPLDPEQEFERLKQRHGMHPDFAMTVADYVYQRDVSNLIKRLYTEDQLDEQGEYANPASTAAPATDGDSAETVSSQNSVDANQDGITTVPEIKAKLDTLEVDYPSNAKKDDLLQMLRDEILERLEILEAEDVDPEAALEVLWHQLQQIERPQPQAGSAG